jgi:branched-subunit amino acid transport protein
MGLALAVLCIGLTTYALRLSMIGLAGRVSLPAGIERALRFVPVAALTALVTPDLLGGAAGASLLTRNPRLWAGVIAALVAWRTRNVVLTVGVGMAALWLLSWLL